MQMFLTGKHRQVLKIWTAEVEPGCKGKNVKVTVGENDRQCEANPCD